MIDGDTLKTRGWRIRLHGIDAPESRQLCFIDGKPWQRGPAATTPRSGGAFLRRAAANGRLLGRRPVQKVVKGGS